MISTNRRNPVWLLDYDLGGHIFRFASEPVSVTDNKGRTYRYDGGLGGISMGSTRLLERVQVAIEIASNVDWTLQQGRGIRLDQRAATLRLWWPGDVLEAATIYADGDAEDVKVGEIGEPLRFSLVEDPERGAAILPGASSAATDDTWPVRGGYTLAEGAEGKSYPIVFGFPGNRPRPGLSTIAEPAIPALWVERDAATSTTERWMYALGRTDAVQVTFWYFDTAWQSGTQTALETSDLLGRTLSGFQASSLAPESATFWVGMKDVSGWGGGLKSPYRDNVARYPLRGAGEVTRYVLEYLSPSTRLDEPRMVAGQAWLDRFKVDGVIAEPVRATDWLTENVLKFLPVLGVEGQGGMYYAPLKWDATKVDRVAHLDADKHMVWRSSDISVWSEPIYNHFTLDYRGAEMGKRYLGRRVLNAVQGFEGSGIAGGPGDPPLPWGVGIVGDFRILGSSICHSSQAKYGIREWSAEHLACWDDDTAVLILQYMALRYAWPKRQVQYVGGIELANIQPGDVVTLTDSLVHIAERVCLVLERKTGGTDVTLDLVILDHPQQVQRITV